MSTDRPPGPAIPPPVDAEEKQASPPPSSLSTDSDRRTNLLIVASIIAISCLLLLLLVFFLNPRGRGAVGNGASAGSGRSKTDGGGRGASDEDFDGTGKNQADSQSDQDTQFGKATNGSSTDRPRNNSKEAWREDRVYGISSREPTEPFDSRFSQGGSSSDGAGFFGVPGTMGSVVYVIDLSGSMSGDRLHRANAELVRSINELEPEQSFGVVYFNTESFPVFSTSKLMKATPSRKRLVVEKVDAMVSAGGTDPSKALVDALSLRPDLIFLLTDGGFGNPQELLSLIQRNNPGRKVSINTIAFVTSSGEKVLEQIAEENRGSYRFVK